jgi:hypothetical protein
LRVHLHCPVLQVFVVLPVAPFPSRFAEGNLGSGRKWMGKRRNDQCPKDLPVAIGH